MSKVYTDKTTGERVSIIKEDDSFFTLEDGVKIKKETFDALQYDDLIDIPKNWIWLRLGEIGFIFNGDSINATVKEQRYTNIEEGYPYVSTKDVGYGFEDIDLYNGVKIPKDEPKFKLARKNTILICAEGGSAGKKWVLSLKNHVLETSCLQFMSLVGFHQNSF
jgi:type I restriction enzyme S subunit